MEIKMSERGSLEATEIKMPGEVSSEAMDIFIIKIIVSKEFKLSDVEEVERIFSEVVKLFNVNPEGKCINAPLNGHNPGYSFKAVQIFSGGFLELGVLEKDRVLFFNLSFLGKLNFDLLEKAAKAIGADKGAMPGALVITRTFSTRY
jgi:hypothetical protein